MIANSKVFLDASIILFLNKTDIFADLCKRSVRGFLTFIDQIRISYSPLIRIPIRTAFPDYTGQAKYEESLEFIQARFKEQRKQGPVSFGFNKYFSQQFYLYHQIQIPK